MTSVLKKERITTVPVTSPCHENHPSKGWKWLPHHLSFAQIWEKIREEAKHDAVCPKTKNRIQEFVFRRLRFV